MSCSAVTIFSVFRNKIYVFKIASHDMLIPISVAQPTLYAFVEQRQDPTPEDSQPKNPTAGRTNSRSLAIPG